MIHKIIKEALQEHSKGLTKPLEQTIMPLTKSKSKSAFKKNVKAEIKSGKSQKQAVAIAYSVKRKAKKK